MSLRRSVDVSHWLNFVSVCIGVLEDFLIYCIVSLSFFPCMCTRSWQIKLILTICFATDRYSFGVLVSISGSRAVCGGSTQNKLECLCSTCVTVWLIDVFLIVWKQQQSFMPHRNKPYEAFDTRIIRSGLVIHTGPGGPTHLWGRYNVNYLFI